MGGMSPPFRLVAGAPAPLQQSSVTCGAACLTVARMLVDDPFARWVRDGTGHPVLGDAIYGPLEARTHPAAQALGRHALHALRLSLPSPSTGEPVRVEAPLPEDFQRALALLR